MRLFSTVGTSPMTSSAWPSVGIFARLGGSFDHLAMGGSLCSRTGTTLTPASQPRIPVWQVAETYIRVAGEWTYLYRAVDGRGATVEFYLSRTRDVESAKLFLRKAMADQRLLPPVMMVTDGNPTYPIAVREMQREKKLPLSCRLRISHSENNLIEQDHRGIQRRADAKQHFRSFGGATHTIAGYEAMHMVRKAQVSECKRGDAAGQAQFVHRLLTQAA